MKLDYLKITDEKCGVKHGGNQSNFGKNVRRSGCGMIAACDMLLYKNGKKSLSDSEYQQFVTSLCKSFFYKHRLNCFGVPAGRIVSFLAKQDLHFRFVPRRKLSNGKLGQLVREALESDTPVIVRVGLNGSGLPYKVTYDTNGRTSCGTMFWHYITVTGAEEDRLFFSSWGATGEMKLDVLQEKLGFMGGIIIPDKIR